MWRLIVACCVLVASGAAAGQCVALTEFAAEPGDIRWRTVNDNVMGGRSRGGYRIEDGALRFRGSTNTNGGGFSSIRSVPKSLALNGDGLALRLRGDGAVRDPSRVPVARILTSLFQNQQRTESSPVKFTTRAPIIHLVSHDCGE